MTEREAYICFSAFPGIGPLRFKLLLEYFGTAVKAWTAEIQEFQKINLGGKLTAKLIDFRQDFNPQDFEKKLHEREIKIVTRIDADFPASLKEIPDPPIALYYKGILPTNWDKAIAIVGTRKPTFYGRNISEKFARGLAQQKMLIVSGLARGVDGIAHRMALQNNSLTVAVLGCGVDIIYPPEHKSLYAEIIVKKGAILSEVPPGHTVLKGLFPQRNRIISGLCKGVLVTEGAKDSGSLITAKYAAIQGKDVFAIPGPITSYLSEGPTILIKNGAKMVTEVREILDELKLPEIKIGLNNLSKSNDFSKEENQILELLTKGELHFDEIVRCTEFASEKLGSILSILELNGIIQNLGNGKYGIK